MSRKIKAIISVKFYETKATIWLYTALPTLAKIKENKTRVEYYFNGDLEQNWPLFEARILFNLFNSFFSICFL